MTDDKNRIIVPLKVARPFCPQCMEDLLSPSGLRMLPAMVQADTSGHRTERLSGFVRDAVRTRAVLLAERISGQKAMTVSEAMRELWMTTV